MFNSIPSPCVPLVGISLGISFSEEPVQRSSLSARNPHTWENQSLSKKYREKLETWIPASLMARADSGQTSRWFRNCSCRRLQQYLSPGFSIEVDGRISSMIRTGFQCSIQTKDCFRPEGRLWTGGSVGRRTWRGLAGPQPARTSPLRHFSGDEFVFKYSKSMRQL